LEIAMPDENPAARALGEAVNQLIRNTAWGHRPAVPRPQRNVHLSRLPAWFLFDRRIGLATPSKVNHPLFYAA
jgi:hypothetical protein